jgi:membrane-associated phospholipid phosphatase
VEESYLKNRSGIIVLLFLVILVLAPRTVKADEIKLNWLVDGPLLAGGLVLAGVGEFALPHLSPPFGSLGPADISQVNTFDRAMMFSYSHPIDLTSTLLEYGTAGLPLVFALVMDSKDIIPLGVVYIESISLALAAKDLLSYFVPRYRPYMYEGGAPGVDPIENDLSFPSGHSTIVFAAATAAVTLYAIYAPDSPYFVPFIVGSYALATTTAALRVFAGMHFTTDVLTGAVIGTAFGFLVPFLHQRISSKQGETGFRMNVGVNEISLGYAY